MNCIWCNNPTQKSTELLPGETLYRCTRCRIVTAAGTDKWVNLDDKRTIEALRLLIDKAKAEKVLAEQVAETPIDDPRWTQINVI